MRLKFGLHALLAVAGVAQITACGDASGPKTGPPAKVVLVSGDSQVAPPVGDKLLQPLTIRVTDAQGQNVSGAEVVWSTSHGSLSAPTSVSNAEGLTSIEWTLGPLAGIQTATATVSGISPVTFTQRAVAGPVSQIILTRDTVELLGIGDSFRMTARPADKFGNTATGSSTIEAADTSVVTVSNFSNGGGAFLTARTSNAMTTIRATAGSIVKLGMVIVLPPPCQPGSSALRLEVGEIATLSETGASEFCVQGTAAGAEFTAIPFYSGQAAGSLLRLSISTGGTTIDASLTRLLATRVQSQRTPPSPRLQRDEAFERDLRERSRREMTPRIPLARQFRQERGRFNLSARAPQVGDLMQLNTNASNPCENPRIRTGRVVAITTRAIVVADTTNPANGFTETDFQGFGATFDTLIYPVDTHNFGEPTDIDKNERVILFFTRAVNELTPPGLSSYVGGYFYSRDLFPKTVGSLEACPASNAAEMFYLLVPDPVGVINQNVRTTDFVRTITAGILAHEFQHLINASRHMYVNLGSSDFEEGFLDEGLAHIAEELVFYSTTGLAPKQNVSASTIQSVQKISDAFETFGAANMRRYREFLINPLTNSPYANNTNITTRGAIWAFLRYAADRRGGLESSAWFQLANPPAGSHGIQNLTRVFGVELTAWVRDWAVANYADDFITGIAPSATHPSWDFRSTVAFVNQGNFPLGTQRLDNVSITSVGIGDGSSAYLRFGVAAGMIGGGRITARGAPLPTGFSLSILRTK
jgi:hypothetical protein